MSLPATRVAPPLTRPVTLERAEDVPGAARAGFALYMLFMCSWFLHFGGRFAWWGALRLDLVLVLLMLACAGMAGLPPAGTDQARAVRRWLGILFAYAVLTIPFVEWPGSVVRHGLEAFSKALVFYLFTVSFVRTNGQMKVLMGVFIAAQSLRVFEPLYLHLTQGYWGSTASMADWEVLDRLSGAPSDVINPNGLAFVVLTVLSFSHFLLTSTKAGALYYAVSLPAHLYTLLLTASRSGMVGLLAVFGVIWYYSRRKVMLLGLAAALAMAAVPYVGADLADRYLSIVSSDTKNATTAEGRLEGVLRDFRVSLRRPLFGHGLGTSREANANFAGNDQPSHNLYTETAQEMGFAGLAVFLAFLASVLRAGAVTARGREQDRDGPRLGLSSRLRISLRVFLLMNILFAFASYGLSSYEWYFLAGVSEVSIRIAGADRRAVGT